MTLRINSLASLGQEGVVDTVSTNFLDKVSQAASEAATDVVTNGVWAYAAISIATLVANRAFASLLPKVAMIGVVSLVAAQQLRK